MIDVFIQARLGSRRFPKKIFKKIGKYSVLSFLIKRLENMKNVNNIVVLTTYKKEDDQIVNFCLKNKIKYFLSFADTKNETPTIANKIKNAVLILHCSASG